MNKSTGDEKYVSIEFDVWQNKYVPMEDKIKQLKQEVEKRVIYVQIVRSRKWISDIEFVRGAAMSKEVSDWGKQQELIDWIKEDSGIDEYNKSLGFLSAQVVKTNAKIDRIPKFVRWLFGIKKIWNE